MLSEIAVRNCEYKIDMSNVWLDSVIRRFQRIPNNPTEKDYYAPFDKLLNSEFDTHDKYTVAPQSFPISSSYKSIDFYIEYQIQLEDKPILIIEIKIENKLKSLSSRKEADSQIRQRLVDIYEECPLNKLYGISFFGTYYSIYYLDKGTMKIYPDAINDDINKIIDVAPVENWNKNIMNTQDAIKLKNIFTKIIDDCELYTANNHQ